MERADIVALDKRYVWHPYTAMDEYIAKTDPLVVVRAEGPYLYDADGTRYLDANGSWWVSTLGHRHPRLVRALTEQAGAFPHVSLAGVTHEPAARLAQELVPLAPGAERTDLPAGRAPLARLLLGQREHGGGGGHQDGRAVLGAERPPQAHALHHALGRLPRRDHRGHQRGRGGAVPRHLRAAALRRGARALAGGGRGLGARLRTGGGHAARSTRTRSPPSSSSPCIQGAAGMQMYPPEFVRAVREATRAVDTFLIADEVFTGMGRTGARFACDLAGVVPDLLCLAKALSGGHVALRRDAGHRAGVLGLPRRRGSGRCTTGTRTAGTRWARRWRARCSRCTGTRTCWDRWRARPANLRPPSSGMAGTIPGLTRPRALGMVGAVDLGGGGYLAHGGWRVYEAARRRGAVPAPAGGHGVRGPRAQHPGRRAGRAARRSGGQPARGGRGPVLAPGGEGPVERDDEVHLRVWPQVIERPAIGGVAGGRQVRGGVRRASERQARTHPRVERHAAPQIR